MPEPILITDFSLGQLSARYAGRVDGARARGAESIQGFLLNRDGGVSRRPGSLYVRDGLGITPATNGLYDSAGTPSFLVYKYDGSRWITFIDGTVLKAYEIEGAGTLSITNSSLTEGVRLDGHVFQDPDDDLYYLHGWTPTYAFDVALSTGSMIASSVIGPSVLFQGRHIGVKRSTGLITMSKELQYRDFVNDETLTRPLSLVADFAGTENVRWIKARQSVYVGTDDGEWEIYSSFPFFSEELGGLMARRIQDIGTQGAEYFGPSLAMRDLSDLILLYPAEGGEYQSRSISERIDNRLLVQHVVNDFGTHRYIHALDVDGNLYTYLDAPAQQVAGWVTLQTDVGWAFAYNKDLYVGIERDGAYSVEVLPLDELTHPGDRSNREHAMFDANAVHGDRGAYHILDASAVTGDEMPPSTLVDVYDLDLSAGTYESLGQTMTDSSGDFAASLAGLKTFTGWTSGEQYLYAHQTGVYHDGSIKTLPITPLIGRKATVARVILQVHESAGAKVRINDHDWEVTSLAAPESGPWYFRPAHDHADELRIEVATVGVKPLNVYQILVEIEAGDE